ncbi:MAG: type II CRISPR-associated endonuclease Cas1 [Erysipelothrix sp.]|nr:type II CRISPR-associated endonuclease Cas1 [Erysipelothrix sp.]
MGWRVVYIEESQRLSLYLDNLKVHLNEDQEILIPLKDINSLICDNYKMTMTVQLLNQCAENNINVVICGIDHQPKMMMIPHSAHHTMSLVLRKQINWDDAKKQLLHQQIIQCKILNQVRLLKLKLIDDSRLVRIESFISEVEPGDPGNREGLAAKMYFNLMFGSDFIRFESDPVNAGLNYGYAIPRSQISKIIYSKGLNASIGIFHKGPSNMFNLSDDIIEPFRPIIDSYVYDHLRLANEFNATHRKDLIRLTTEKISINNQSHTIFNAMNIMIESIIKYFDDDSPISLPIIV